VISFDAEICSISRKHTNQTMKKVIHVVSNLLTKSYCTEVCGHLGSISLITSEVGKSAHAATIDKTEHNFPAIKIYPYMPNIISEVDFEPSEITRTDKLPGGNLERKRRALKC
jgi:hypothetical protein